MERWLAVSGWLAARERATLSVKVPGRLKWIGVDVGSVVQPQEPLAQVEPRDYELRLQQAASALAQARAALGLPLEGDDDRLDPEQATPVRQARAVLDEATQNRLRVRNLSQAGISSASEQDTVEASYLVARERYQAAFEETRSRQAALAQRRAELELARQQLTDTTLKAPFPGVIQARLAQLGEYLPTGSAVVTLVQTDPLRLRLEVPEREAAAVHAGQAVRLEVEGEPALHEGKLARISPALNEDNRMLVVEADIPNRGSLRPGLFARGQIVLRADEPGLAVPANALIVFAGLEKVVTVRDGQALEKVVATGRRSEGWIEVLSGLKLGEQVVLDPGGLRTGQPVRIESLASSTAATRDPGHAETR
jgi:RND family efflux transporter MFP subunit